MEPGVSSLCEERDDVTRVRSGPREWSGMRKLFSRFFEGSFSRKTCTGTNVVEAVRRGTASEPGKYGLQTAPGRHQIVRKKSLPAADQEVLEE